MHIWIDNDGCPARMREIVFKASTRLMIPVTVVGNSFMHVPKNGLTTMIVVDSGFDAADKYIIDNVVAGDLVITTDIPLASAIVDKGAFGLSSRGEEYTVENAREKLAMRNLAAEVRSTGTMFGGPPPMNDKDINRFASAFDRLVTRLHQASLRKKQQTTE
jgi:uncharacterized protein YaiI (UPF0178 family)